MAVAGELTKTDSENVMLQSVKNAVTRLTFIIMYLVTTALLTIEEEEEINDTVDGGNMISWSDRHLFAHLALGGAAIGLCVSLAFHFLIKTDDLMVTKNQMEGKGIMYGLNWLKRPPFWTLLVFYSLTWTLFVIILTYQPFYLQITLGLDKQFIGMLPLVKIVGKKKANLINFSDTIRSWLCDFDCTATNHGYYWQYGDICDWIWIDFNC